jgi:hypothetical protein
MYTRKRRRDPGAIDTDMVRVLSPEQEKKRRLHKEGKCFLCKK